MLVKFTEWWARCIDRPSRITTASAFAAIYGLSVEEAQVLVTKDRWHENDEWCDEVIGFAKQLKRFGFENQLFEDGWFWVPSTKLQAFPRPKKVYLAPVDSDLEAAAVEGTAERSVYFIQSSSGGPIKIGVTGSVLKRLGELQTGNPFRLHLLLALSETKFTEKQLHEMFVDLRIPGGEWFHPGDALLDFLDEHVFQVCGIPRC